MRKHHQHMNKRHGGADAGRTGEGSDARSAGERKSEMIIYTENILLPEVVRTSCECEWPATAASRGKQVGTQLKSQGWASTTFFTSGTQTTRLSSIAAKNRASARFSGTTLDLTNRK